MLIGNVINYMFEWIFLYFACSFQLGEFNQKYGEQTRFGEISLINNTEPKMKTK